MRYGQHESFTLRQHKNIRYKPISNTMNNVLIILNKKVILFMSRKSFIRIIKLLSFKKNIKKGFQIIFRKFKQSKPNKFSIFFRISLWESVIFTKRDIFIAMLGLNMLSWCKAIHQMRIYGRSKLQYLTINNLMKKHLTCGRNQQLPLNKD